MRDAPTRGARRRLSRCGAVEEPRTSNWWIGRSVKLLQAAGRGLRKGGAYVQLYVARRPCRNAERASYRATGIPTVQESVLATCAGCVQKCPCECQIVVREGGSAKTSSGSAAEIRTQVTSWAFDTSKPSPPRPPPPIRPRRRRGRTAQKPRLHSKPKARSALFIRILGGDFY